MAATPKAKFMMLGKSKFVHVVRTKAWDLKNSGCQQVRKFQVADNVPKGKGISPAGALELEPCPHCEPGAVIRSEFMTDEQRKRVAKQTTQDTLDKMRDAKRDAEPKSKQKRKSVYANLLEAKTTKAGQDASRARARAVKSETGDKAPKAGKPQMTKTGPKSLGGDEEKANILKAFAEEHGWKVKVTEDKPGYKLVAKRGKETITCWFDGGKYDLGRVGYVSVEGSDWQGKLRAAHACRRQMAGEGRDRPHPHPGVGRSAPRAKAEEPTPETESPEDALKRVPFLIDDDELVVLDAIKGKVIRWRNGVSGEVEEAQLPAEATGKKRPKIVITTHPTKNRRIVHFFSVAGIDSGTGKEVYGPERSVALDKIIRVL